MTDFASGLASSQTPQSVPVQRLALFVGILERSKGVQKIIREVTESMFVLFVKGRKNI